MEALIAIISAIIGALATIISPLVSDWLKSKRTSTNIANITGVWQHKTEKSNDIIKIDKQNGRYIEGSRIYTGSDGITKDYIFTGYFDGKTAAMAITSVSSNETRTLGILLHRLDSDTLNGCRFFDGQGQTRYFSNIRFHKQR